MARRQHSQLAVTSITWRHDGLQELVLEAEGETVAKIRFTAQVQVPESAPDEYRAALQRVADMAAEGAAEGLMAVLVDRVRRGGRARGA